MFFVELTRRLYEARFLKITHEFRVIHFLPEYNANLDTTRVLLDVTSARYKCEFSIIARATQHNETRRSNAERSESQSRALCGQNEKHIEDRAKLRKRNLSLRGHVVELTSARSVRGTQKPQD